MNQVYLDSARLLTRVARLVLVDDTFALKGGTAINLFVRDMPRLSVDLDLVFPEHKVPRAEALNRLNVATSRAKCASVLVGSPQIFGAECRTPRQIQLANAFCRYLEMVKCTLSA